MRSERIVGMVGSKDKDFLFYKQCIEGHEAAITDVSIVSKEIDTDGSILIASTSKDETTRLWRVLNNYFSNVSQYFFIIVGVNNGQEG